MAPLIRPDNTVKFCLRSPWAPPRSESGGDVKFASGESETLQSVHGQGRSQKFVSGGGKTGGLGTEVPQRGPGAEPWWGSGAKLPEAEDMYAKNRCNNVLTRNP